MNHCLLWVAKTHSPFSEDDLHLFRTANVSEAKWSSRAVTGRRMEKAELSHRTPGSFWTRGRDGNPAD
jgi:hypothetical protein